ncbi:MAG: PIG-L family deacetylase [Acidobacteriales bacterium]|nr:PIG-L family deacetylase [Terriglobales bacterium]
MNQLPPWARLRDGGTSRLPLRSVLLAAHPDDETIGASVALARFVEPHIVYLTDGAPLDRRFWSPDMQSASREAYAEVRRQEALCALQEAGIPSERVYCLGAIDQQAIEEVPRLTYELTKLLVTIQPDLLITHPYEGGHPDHDAAALIAALAIASLHANSPELLEMTSYHARSGGLVTGEFLPGSENVPQCELQLTRAERERKSRMMACHHSQRAVLASFKLDRERLRLAPSYDFSKPPHPGQLWYECLAWPLSGEKWRAHAIAAVTSIGTLA